MATAVLVHPPISPWLIRGPDACRVTLFAGGEPPARVYLRGDPDNEELLIAMSQVGSVNGLARYEAELPWDLANLTTHYAFKVLYETRQVWLAADGVHAHTPPREQLFKICRDHQPPAWVRNQIVYQIFPDRFCQGDPSIAVQTDEYVYGTGESRVVQKPWGAPIDRSVAATAFYGGDLIGVRQQLDYLRDELGVTTLYLNPVFTSGSNHKYDVEDYDHVDRHLGGDRALAELAGDLHARHMRLVLDAVVNHTGANHPWFNRFGRHPEPGAYQAESSRWRSWYVFSDDGAYAGWKGHGSLPVLDFANPSVQAAVYYDRQSIVRQWMRAPFSIDGWRFDVVHMMGEGSGALNNAYYVRELRRVLREENPEAYLLGEHFFEATRWLQGDQEDGAMNYYGFAQPVRAWLAGRDAAGHPAALSTVELERWLAAARARIPYANQLAQLNLLDSHDTSRFLTAAAGDVRLMRLAVTLLLTYAGVPSIYYGDEIGLEGGDDPDCRRCFDWDRTHWNTELHAHYRQLIEWRRQRDELRRGAYQTLVAAGDAFVFARYTEDDITVVAINRGPTAVTLDLPLGDLPLEVIFWRIGDATELVRIGRIELPAYGQVVAFGEA